MNRQGSDEKQNLTHDSYTVGWICVLRSELNASRALLDEVHRRLPQVEKDDNSYLLGRMAGHNVVIAFTGSGMYGTNAAAQTATHLTRTFRKIRFGLMVGVGGGAPKPPDLIDPLKDIRLGDVVVSVAKGSHGGVLQYDMGEWENENEFRIKSHLNKPPKVLSKAIELLQSNHDFGEGNMTQYINEVALKSRRFPALKECLFPGRDQDQLFKSDYLHAGGSDCSSCDATQLEKRLSRDVDDPVIHYGLVASGNAVMRSAQRRDKLRDAWDALCFEMEAAGLMDDFPCVIIRGICDYSDDHKRKVWQPYSAVAAAAYAKDLLSVVQPQEVESMEAAAMIAKFSESIKATGEAVNRIESTVAKDKDSQVLDWLTPVDYGSQYSDLLKTRQPGTGQWFLDSEKYQTWLGTRKQTLFCPGIPGAGKTIVASIVVENLFSRFESIQGVVIAYLYCNFQQQSKQQADDLLASLLRQLARGLPSLPDSLRSLYDSHENKKTQPSSAEISQTLQSVAAMFSRVFIIVDALDECQESNRCRSTFLSQLSSLQANTGANIFATSRPIQDNIKGEFESVEILEISARSGDVESYIDGRASELLLLDEKNWELSKKEKETYKRKIKKIISDTVNGVFLLAKFHMDSLVNKTTPFSLNDALRTLPVGRDALTRTYGNTIMRIRTQSKDLRYLAERVLTLLTCAERLLTTSELRDALAVRPGTAMLDEDKRECTSIIVSACAGLVTVDDSSGIIRLLHDTARQYLRTQMFCIKPQEDPITLEGPVDYNNSQENYVAMVDAHRTFMIICVTYLSFSVFKSGFCLTDTEFEKRLQANPLYDYAAHNWGHHAREAATCSPSVMEFLSDPPKVEASGQALMAVRSSQSEVAPKRVNALHLTAHFGTQEAVRILLQDWQNIDQQDGWGRTPLSLAAKNGHEAVVKLLLATEKVNVNMKDQVGHTPFSHAVEKGHEAVVKLLLATEKVDVNIKDNWGQTPLSSAAWKGFEAIVEILLSTEKIDVDVKESWGFTPLSHAAAEGHEAIVKLLLATEKVDVNAEDNFGQTPLSYAAENGHKAIVKLLLATEKVGMNAGDEAG